MRLGLRVPPRSSGGGLVFFDQLVRSLARSDVEITRFVMGGDSVQPGGGVEDVVVQASAHAALRRVKGSGALARAVASNPVDLMLSPGTEVTRVPEIPTVMWPLTVAPLEAPTMRRLGTSAAKRLRWELLRQGIRSAVGRADALVFSSYYARALYHEELPGARDLPSCVISPAASIGGGDDPSATAPLAGRRPYLLFVSHLYPYKMVVEMIRGWSLAVQHGVDLDLRIAGAAVDARYESRVLAAVAESAAPDRVHLMGSVDAALLPDLYRGAYGFVFPSLSENAGSYALIDAFGFGVPVLASSTSSMPEACQDAARYFDPRDPGHLAREIEAVWSSEELRSELERRGLRRASQLNSWDDIASGFLAFAENLLRRR